MKKTLVQKLGLLGVVSFLSYAAAVAFAPLAYPGYDWMAQAVSDLSGGLCVWGGINLLEGYGQDNPAAKSQGVKQLVAGGGVALIGVTLIPLLSGLLG